ncbi:MAG: inositol monophosphatase [Rhodospirillaceae bacterium]|nr:inositol monophosphatase [Rhodospirillaceae bacterium]
MAMSMGIDLDFDAVGEIMQEAADNLVCPRFCCLDAESIHSKSHKNDLVTIADLETEVFLSQRLMALLPGSVAMGEEAVYRDPRNRAYLDGDDPVWIIDPVDGTANFARGNPAFGIIVALVHHRQTLAGWIYAPLERRLFTTERGGGCWCAGKRLSMNTRDRGALSTLTGTLGRRMAERLGKVFGTITQSGCAAHDYISLCEGRLDFRLFRLLFPWDHAAGVLMVEEAGGCVRLLSGDFYAPIFQKADGLLIAPNADLWEDIRHALVS